jgi:D-alanyl-D-alanine carboxypeptidase
VIRDLPEYEYFVHIPAIRFGRRVTQNFNKLIGRYPGADGFKTGFICASGYNLVASATRDGKRLIAVVLGSPRATRAVRAAQLWSAASPIRLAWLRPSLGTVDNLAPIDATPPNLRDEMCGGKRKRPATDEDDATMRRQFFSGQESRSSFLSPPACKQPMPKPSELMAQAPGRRADGGLYRPTRSRLRP